MVTLLDNLLESLLGDMTYLSVSPSPTVSP